MRAMLRSPLPTHYAKRVLATPACWGERARSIDLDDGFPSPIK
ncbi:MAG TPA: hypothetical protein VF026_03025 [Ktedonobacteraceae bacterium]